MTGVKKACTDVVYGAGLRLDESLKLRFEDFDVKGRNTTLPVSVKQIVSEEPWLCRKESSE